MKTFNNTNKYYKPKQLKLPLEIEKIIEISDPVYSFCEIVDCIDLNSYFAKKGCKTGRPRYNRTNLLKIILFSFMENGYLSLRGIEKSCKTDIRYMWLLDDMKAPTFVTIGNFIRDDLTSSIEDIFLAINKVIFEKEHVDLDHTYIDGTKIEANANKYTWVWKKSCITNRDKTFGKVSEIIEKMNNELDECRIIVAAECVEEALFRFGCITERVRVKQVFAGDDIRTGDIIDVGRASSCLFLDESMYVNEKPLLNMGFVRGMKKGSTYLIFLEQEKETNEKYRLFVQPQNLLMAPIFEYGQTDSNVLNSITTDSYHNVYKNIKESEFFLMSEKTIEQMYNLKSDLLKRYSLEGDNDD